MPFLVSLVFSFVPMFLFALFIYWLDRYEKEPKLLLGGVFIWGAVFAASSAFIINTVIGAGIYLVTESEGAANITTGSLIAPVVEETLKGMAVLLVFLTFRSEFDSVMDGIVYAAVTALGFAATENLHYIYNLGYLENGWNGLISMILMRDIVVSWQHPFYTAFIGIGLAAARLNQNLTVKITAPLLGLGTAIFFHSLHNTLAGLGDAMCIFGSILDWSGWLLMFIFILAMVNNEKKLLIQFLKSEVETGLISLQQYQTACSPNMRNRVNFSALIRGNARRSSRFYHLCSELAHKKRQLEKFGEEGGNSLIISSIRKELETLSLKN
jgi:RsiW-degrading membrane proteinase PrsW (M82 family)